MPHAKSIVIHLGLPKTGSTALQDVYLSGISSKNSFFLGKSVRKNICHPALVYMREYLSSSENEKYKKLFLKEIGKIRERRLIVSDEMFVVDTEKCSWQNKIKRLAALINAANINLEMVIVLYRDPWDAVYSMYVENYNFVSKEYRNITEYALNCNQALIYKYSCLHEVLCECFGEAKIKYVDYDAIKTDGGVANVLPLMKLPVPEIKKKDRVNEKKKLGNEYISNPASAKDFLLRFGFVKNIIRKVPRRYYHRFSEFFSGFNVGRGKVVKKPSYDEEKIIREFLNEGTENFYLSRREKVLK